MTEAAAGARIIGRYALYSQIAAGGMAAVHLGRMFGQAGFSRTVAIKRLHPHLAQDPEFVSMLIDEARLAARVRHPNVVATLDVVAQEHELLVVMEYVHGESLARILRTLREKQQRVPPPIAVSIACNVLQGLHAAHEATNERGEPLGIIHRDVSPQNVMMGSDGVARVVDFGVAKAAGRLQETREGQLKGKIRYMSPEMIKRQPVGRGADVYAASVVLWEALVGRRLFEGDNDLNIAQVIIEGAKDPPGAFVPELPLELNAVVMRGLDPNPEQRYSTALEMAEALEDALTPATPRRVARWIEEVAQEALRMRAAKLHEVEGLSAALPVRMEADSSAELSPVSRDRSIPQLPVGGSEDPTVRDASEPSKSMTGSWSSTKLPPIAGLQRAGRLGLAAAALVLMLLVGAGALAARAWLAPSADEAAVPSSLPEPSPSRVAVSAPAPAPPLPPTPSAAAPPPPSASPSVSKERAVPRPTQTSSKPAKPKANCNPPYYYDADGTKVLKRECL